MKFCKNLIFCALIVLIVGMFSKGFAEVNSGVQIYPGAKADAASTKMLKEQMGVNGVCYITNDTLSKVLDFYKKQPGVKMISTGKESAMLQKESVDITVQNPWMDMQSGAMKKTTLISIVKN